MTQSHPKLRSGAQGAPKEPNGIPRELKGGKSDSKDGPLGDPGAPKPPITIPREPKGDQSHPQDSKMSSKDIQRRATNHKTIYT